MAPPFTLFGLDHLLALGLLAFGSALAFRWGQADQDGAWARRLGRSLAGLAVVLLGARLLDGFHPDDDLPLWLCDVAFGLCIWCLFRPALWNLALVVYWGLAGTLQALITPDVPSGFPSPAFLLFFIGHALIVLAVVFLLGRHLGPELSSPRAVGMAFGGLLLYAVAVGALDALLSWNYGYLRAKPSGASVLDRMGDWPWYIASALGFALLLFVLLAGLLRWLAKATERGDDTRPGG